MSHCGVEEKGFCKTGGKVVMADVDGSDLNAPSDQTADRGVRCVMVNFVYSYVARASWV